GSRPRDQRPAVIAFAVSLLSAAEIALRFPGRGLRSSLASPCDSQGARRFAHPSQPPAPPSSRLPASLEQWLDHRSQIIRVAGEQLFPVNQFSLTFSLGHGVYPSCRIGDVELHPHTMTARPSDHASALQNYQDTTDARGSMRSPQRKMVLFCL